MTPLLFYSRFCCYLLVMLKEGSGVYWENSICNGVDVAGLLVEGSLLMLMFDMILLYGMMDVFGFRRLRVLCRDCPIYEI